MVLCQKTSENYIRELVPFNGMSKFGYKNDSWRIFQFLRFKYQLVNLYRTSSWRCSINALIGKIIWNLDSKYLQALTIRRIFRIILPFSMCDQRRFFWWDPVLVLNILLISITIVMETDRFGTFVKPKFRFGFHQSIQWYLSLPNWILFYLFFNFPGR